MKQLGVYLLIPRWDASPSQGYPPRKKNCPIPFSRHLDGGGTAWVIFLAYEENLMYLARTQNLGCPMRGECTKHDATTHPNYRVGRGAIKPYSSYYDTQTKNKWTDLWPLSWIMSLAAASSVNFFSSSWSPSGLAILKGAFILERLFFSTVPLFKNIDRVKLSFTFQCIKCWQSSFQRAMTLEKNILPVETIWRVNEFIHKVWLQLINSVDFCIKKNKTGHLLNLFSTIIASL